MNIRAKQTSQSLARTNWNGLRSRLYAVDITLHQLKLIRIRAKLANLSDCSVPFLYRTGANLC